MPASRTAAVPTPRTAADDAGYGSLTRLPRSARRACPACGADSVTSLAMTLTDGSLVDFASCHACEHRSWSQGGRALPLAVVLEKTRKLPKQASPAGRRAG